MNLYDKIADPRLTIRRLNLTAAQVVSEEEAARPQDLPEQLDMFTNYAAPGSAARKRRIRAGAGKAAAKGRSGSQKALWQKRPAAGRQPHGWSHRQRAQRADWRA